MLLRQCALFYRSYLKCITFLASFEMLNIPITYELFCNSPKEGMIKGLWKNHSHEAMVRVLVPAWDPLCSLGLPGLCPVQPFCSKCVPSWLVDGCDLKVGLFPNAHG